VNFERAKGAADRLRLPEVRLQAYLQIAMQTVPDKVNAGQLGPYSPSAAYLKTLNR
jgi:hypothetical protein